MNRNKVYDYVVVLKNPNRKLIAKTAQLMLLLSLLPFAAAIYSDSNNFLTYLAAFVSMAFFISALVEKKRKKHASFALAVGVTGLGLFFSTTIPYLGQLYLLAGILEWFFFKNTEVGFSNDIIVKSGIFPQKIKWSELNNVLIRDDLFTMDFKNNQLFQAYTDDAEDEEYEVGDDEFNEYCKERLNQ